MNTRPRTARSHVRRTPGSAAAAPWLKRTAATSGIMRKPNAAHCSIARRADSSARMPNTREIRHAATNSVPRAWPNARKWVATPSRTTRAHAINHAPAKNHVVRNNSRGPTGESSIANVSGRPAAFCAKSSTSCALRSVADAIASGRRSQPTRAPMMATGTANRIGTPVSGSSRPAATVTGMRAMPYAIAIPGPSQKRLKCTHAISTLSAKICHHRPRTWQDSRARPAASEITCGRNINSLNSKFGDTTRKRAAQSPGYRTSWRRSTHHTVVTRSAVTASAALRTAPGTSNSAANGIRRT